MSNILQKPKKVKHIDLTASNRDEAEKRPEPVEFDRLFLDPENPRLAEVSYTKTQGSIQKVMEKQFDLEPIMDSLYKNGFFWEEPLVAVLEPLAELHGKKVLVVIEGNRRLAAVKFIQENPSRFPDAPARRRLKKIPVIIRTDREETLSFVGFRHVTGIMGWESAAMAQYALRLVKGGHTVDEVALLIGDKTKKIERLIRTQSLIEHANSLGIAKDDAAKTFYFSYLLTVTDAPATKKWLNLATDSKKGIVRTVNEEKLKRLWSWLYGSKQAEISAAISESRQIHKLNRVLAVKEATKELEKTGNLERAFAYTKTREEYVSEVLGAVRSELQDMFTTVFPEGPLVEDEKSKEHIASAKQEINKIETVLASIKPLLQLS